MPRPALREGDPLATEQCQGKVRGSSDLVDTAAMKPIARIVAKKIWSMAPTAPRTLRSELLTSILLGLLAIFIPVNIAIGIRERQEAIQDTHNELALQGAFVHLGVMKWSDNMGKLMQLVKYSPQTRRLDKENTETIFKRLTALYPHRAWSLWGPSGKLVSGNHFLNATRQESAEMAEMLDEAKRGRTSYWIFSECQGGNPCYVESAPVYPIENATRTERNSQPIGMLGVSVYLKDLGQDTGLERYYDEMVGQASAARRGKESTIRKAGQLSLQNGAFTGNEIMMVSKDGYVIFPITTINDALSLQEPDEIRSGPWGPFAKLGQTASKQGTFHEVRSGSHTFFAYTGTIDEKWNIVVISDKESSLRGVNANIKTRILYQLLTLTGVTIAIVWVTRRYADRIELAATTIREFSEGNFEARIRSKRAGAMGKLYKDINQTGAKLRDLLTNQLAHAVTDQQIKTATDIQKSFFLDVLPGNSSVELAGMFDPAYEIGADWYDALSLGNTTYVVIADVCDKGIASALFMSVFRSLTRYSLLVEDENNKSTQRETGKMLQEVITQVNSYMATNHGESAMFATLFLGAYVSQKKQLEYVCAGHESPLIIRSEGQLEKLQTTGPAIGIFGDARYEVKTTVLNPGEILFTYTDGLVDARSSENTAWGMQGITAVLQTIKPMQTTAQQLLDEMSARVMQHRGDAEQFDDLTMLIMKVK